jgi:Flp pilus assembly protein TadD
LPKSAKVPPSAELAELARLSGVAMYERDYARAVPLLQRATRLAPQLGVVHSNLGEALRRLGRKREALEAFPFEPRRPTPRLPRCTTPAWMHFGWECRS